MKDHGDQIHNLSVNVSAILAHMIRHESQIRALQDLIFEHVADGDPVRKQELDAEFERLQKNHHQDLLEMVEDLSPEAAVLLDRRRDEDL